MGKKILKIVEKTLFAASVTCYAASFILFMLRYYFRVSFLLPYDLLPAVVCLFAGGVMTALIMNGILTIVYPYEPAIPMTPEERAKLRKMIEELHP